MISGKLWTDDEEDDEPDPAVVAAICERIAALATADTTRETVARYRALAAALREADVASALAAVRELRQIGLVSFSESVPPSSTFSTRSSALRSTATMSAYGCKQGSMN